jgi:hypothetical protein
MARLPLYLALVVGLSLIAEAAHAQSSPILTTNPTLQASLERIAKGSLLWRQAIDAIRATGRRAVVVTPDQVRVVDADGNGGADRFDHSILAEVAPVPHEGGQVDAVVVVVNLPLLESRYEELRLLPVEFEMDLDRILVHEIYGHAVPYLLAGHLSGRCADPQPRERVTDACSIRRENAVRGELGLGRRVDYGLDGLNMVRRLR